MSWNYLHIKGVIYIYLNKKNWSRYLSKAYYFHFHGFLQEITLTENISVQSNILSFVPIFTFYFLVFFIFYNSLKVCSVSLSCGRIGRSIETVRIQEISLPFGNRPLQITVAICFGVISVTGLFSYHYYEERKWTKYLETQFLSNGTLLIHYKILCCLWLLSLLHMYTIHRKGIKYQGVNKHLGSSSISPRIN